MSEKDGIEVNALIPDHVAQHLIDQMTKPLPAFSFYFRHKPLPPLTRRQRLRGKWLAKTYRIRTAIDVLRGRHSCGEWD